MPKITENNIKQHIKTRAFSPVYLIYGAEQLYVHRYTDRLVHAVAGKEPSEFNFHRFAGEFTLTEFAASMYVTPFMSEYNLVLVSDPFLDMMAKDELDTFLEICKNPVEGTVLVISFPSNTPKEKTLSAVVKAVEKTGSVMAFQKTNVMTVEKFVAKWANENDKLISRAAANRLVSLCGDDLTRLKNEVDKVCAYAAGEEVSVEDINKMATVNLESRVFDLSNAVLEGNGEKAFQVLNLLFDQKEEPIAMLYILSNAYIDAYRVRVAAESGVMNSQLAGDFGYGKRTFVLDKVKRSTARVSTEALRRSLGLLVEADIKFKSVRVNYRLYLEQLIAQLLLTAKEAGR